MAATIAGRQDVISWCKAHVVPELIDGLQAHWLENWKMNAKDAITTKRDVVTVHVRKGDVSAYLYDPVSFTERHQAVADFLDDYDRRLWEFESSSYGLLKDYDWGQSAMSPGHIDKLIALIRDAHPHQVIEVVCQKTDLELQEIVRGHRDVVIWAEESEMESLARMASSDVIYIANSFMGLLAGMLAPAATVRYPPNAMHAVFGLGSWCDRTEWAPYDLQ